MSPIGRIFIVLNLILAVTFMGWASSALSHSQDFKTQLEDAQKAHDDMKADLEGQLETSRNETSDAMRHLSDAEGERDRINAENSQLQASHTSLQQDHDQLLASVDRMSESLGEYSARNDDLNGRVEDLTGKTVELTNDLGAMRDERDDLQTEKNDLERSLKEANDSIASLEADVTARENRIAELDTVIQTASETFGTDLFTLHRMPHISGAVLIVSDDQVPGLVSINRGTADNVQRGFTFDVFSGGMYKGKVRVVDVQENQCFCIIESVMEGRSILQGDSARTHI